MIIKLFHLLLTAGCLWATAASATELKPWFGRVFEIEARASCLMQQFSSLDASPHKIKRDEFDAFYRLSAAAAVWETIAAEIELGALSTKHREFGMEAFRLTGRYRLMNDIVGDPVSLTTGVTLSTIFEPARRNLATFDHGGIAAEAHVAVGKEMSCEEFWTSRLWGVGAIGIADVGSPWLRADLHWERSWWERHQLELFALSIWGLGGDNLHCQHHFHGYGSIHYQAVDMGIGYKYRFCNDAQLTFAYAYRVHAKNGPRRVNFFLIEFMYPFGVSSIPFLSKII